MSTYYQFLKIPENATFEEIHQAYTSHLKKWQHLKEQQPEHLQESINKVLAHLAEVYDVLSNPVHRAAYDLSLKDHSDHHKMSHNTDHLTSDIRPPRPQPNANKILYTIIGLLLFVVLGMLYLIYQTYSTTSYPPHTVLTKNPPNQPVTTKISATLQAAIEKASQQKKQNAQDVTLKALAKTIADNTNKNLNTILNNNTKFIGAQAANQNVTFRFVVIDGITYSSALLSTYLKERFIVDNNDICNNQQINLAKGILYTFAYYDSKSKLIASYYLDQQVCQSPLSEKIIKRPDSYQLEAKEIPTNSNYPTKTHSDSDQTTP